MKSPNEQMKEFEKWYRIQWIKVTVKYALLDFIKSTFKIHTCNQ